MKMKNKKVKYTKHYLLFYKIYTLYGKTGKAISI